MSDITVTRLIPLHRQHLRRGRLNDVTLKSCVHYDIWLHEHMTRPELYIHVQVRAGGFEVIQLLVLRVLSNGELVNAPYAHMHELMERHIGDKHVARLNMGNALKLAIDKLVTGARAGSPHVNIMLHCIARWDGPEPMQDIANLYVGSARHARDMGMALPKRERVPGNQGGWLTGRQKSDWTVRERRTLRLLNKLIKGVQD